MPSAPPRIAFAGTPEFAAVALRALLDAGHDIPLVLTQPDRPAGRGMQPQPSAVKRVAVERGIPLAQPDRLRDPATHAPLREAAVDVLVVAAYGLILPQAVLDIPRAGCINIHASLLPRWRGAAPIQRAIEAGDEQTGISLMRMEAGLDTGPVLLAEALAIGTEETAGELHDRLAMLGARLLIAAIPRLESLPAVAQPEAGVTYAAKVDKAEAQLDWALPAVHLARKVRAFNPFPGAVATLGGQPTKLWRATPASGSGRPGQILAADGTGIVVACGENALRITELQRPGGRRVAAADFLRGNPLNAG